MFGDLIVFLGVCLGHAGVLIFTINWLHGHALPRRFLRAVRRVLVPAVPATPLAIWLIYGFDVFAGWGTSLSWWRVALIAYAALCVALGLVVLPLLTLVRLLRPRPAVVRRHAARTIDIAKHLGYPPVGDGKYHRVAHWPFNQVFQVEFVERTLCLPRLPEAWDGLTILHLTDLHLCGTPDRAFFEQVIEHCKSWGVPDLVAATGDIVDSSRHHRWIIPVLGRLNWRHEAFAILGNHDGYHGQAERVRRRLRRLGVQVLGNSWSEIALRGERGVVIGHEGPWFRPGPDLADCPEGGFRLCLSHTPDNLPWARRHDIALMLAGHNHGGQIRLPGIGSILIPSRFSRRYDCGTFHEPPTTLHVSRGLAGQHPLRYFCKPELTWLVLRAGKALEAGG
jgi:predicted MPP superfamily phosphohydrolase